MIGVHFVIRELERLRNVVEIFVTKVCGLHSKALI